LKAILVGSGVGESSASVTAAVINWVHLPPSLSDSEFQNIVLFDKQKLFVFIFNDTKKVNCLHGVFQKYNFLNLSILSEQSFLKRSKFLKELNFCDTYCNLFSKFFILHD
jgi:hypothetical protein